PALGARQVAELGRKVRGRHGFPRACVEVGGAEPTPRRQQVVRARHVEHRAVGVLDGHHARAQRHQLRIAVGGKQHARLGHHHRGGGLEVGRLHRLRHRSAGRRGRGRAHRGHHLRGRRGHRLEPGAEGIGGLPLPAH
ncbi:MAG: hypothetical protein ACK55I_00650, partial [bacterium]